MATFRRSLLVFIITFLVCSLLFGVIALLVVPKVNDLLGFADSVERGVTEDGSGELIETGTVVGGKGGLTALFVGVDQVPGVTTGESVSADTIIFLTVSESKKAFVYVSLPCRMEVVVDGETMFLGNVYGRKGIRYLAERVTGLTGVAVNYYAVVTIEGMKKLIDGMGGIEVSVPVNMRYKDESQDLEIDITRGYQKLDGEQAVNMLRYRGDSFRERGTRNLDFLKMLVREFTASDRKAEAADVFLRLSDDVETNFTEKDLLKYLDLIWSYSEYDEISLEYPGKYTTNDDGYTIYRPKTDSAYAMIAEYKN